MKVKFVSLTFALVLFTAIGIRGQDAIKQPVALRATVGDVTDNRTTGQFNPECKVELRFTGDAAADAQSIRQVNIKTATDELGRNLIPEKSEESFNSFNSSGSGHRSGGLKVEVKLRNPSRNAAVIKVLEGEVELFNPTPANGGALVIKDILKNPAEPVNDPVLKKYGVEVIYLTKESYDAKKKEMATKQGAGDALGGLFSGMFSGMMNSESKNNLKLYVKDPQKRVSSVEFENAEGRPLKSRSSWTSNEMRSQDFDAPPPPDTQLMIHLATPESIQTMPFKLENIPLP